MSVLEAIRRQLACFRPFLDGNRKHDVYLTAGALHVTLEPRPDRPDGHLENGGRHEHR
jgi:hypothetical protein